MQPLTIFMKINRYAGAAAMTISMFLLIYMVLHISLEIVLRAFFSLSTFSMDEFVGYAVGAMTFLALSDTFRERKHIRVGIMLNLVRGRMAVLIETLCILLTFGMTVFLARFIWRMLARDFQRGSVSPTMNEVPVWLLDGVIFLGLALFMIQLIASLIDTLQHGYRPEAAQGD